MKKHTLFFVGFLLMLGSCKPKEPKQEIGAGTADFSRFIAIGDGHTAGYMDDALSLEGQKNSLGYILQQQLMLVGAPAVQMPWMPDQNIGLNWTGLSRFILGYKTDCQGVTSLSPVRFNVQGELNAFGSSAFNGTTKFTNFGVPGVRFIDMVSNALGNTNLPQHNPYFARLSMDQFNLPGSGNFSSLQENIFNGGYPTFCSVYLGIEDVLPFAKSGATTDPMTPVFGTPTIGFEEAVTQLFEQLYNQNVNAVVATIPDVTAWPFFTTIPYNGLKLDAEKAASLNQIYNPIGFSFQVGENPFMIADPSAGMFGVRPAQPGELILLSAPLDSVKCNQMGSVFPFRNEFVLTLDEISTIQSRIDEFNVILRQKAATYGFALVETNQFYQKLVTGFSFNGVSLSSKFVSGGAFSLDGIHLNARGNALLANEFIKAINKKFSAKIPLINALSYNAILFP